MAPQMRPHPPTLAQGFSLLELAVALAIVALLGGLSYPQYRQHWARAQRTQAQLALSENVGFVQHQQGTGNPPSPALPVEQLPRSGGPVLYRFSVTHDGNGAYVLQAVPEGPLANDPCQTYQIDHTGALSLWQGTQRLSDPDLLQRCWNR